MPRVGEAISAISSVQAQMAPFFRLRLSPGRQAWELHCATTKYLCHQRYPYHIDTDGSVEMIHYLPLRQSKRGSLAYPQSVHDLGVMYVWATNLPELEKLEAFSVEE